MRAGVAADREISGGTLLQGSSPPWELEDDDWDDELDDFLLNDFDADELGLDPEEPYDA